MAKQKRLHKRDLFQMFTRESNYIKYILKTSEITFEEFKGVPPMFYTI